MLAKTQLRTAKFALQITVISLLILLVFQVTQTSGANEPITILPLGDSITQGENQSRNKYNSYRRALWQMLQTNGYTNVDFVGSWDVAYPNQPPPNPDFDMDHEGHWGWYAEEMINGCDGCPVNSGSGKLADWLQGYTPDIVLLHVGSNDLKDPGSDAAVVAQTINEIGQIIDILRIDNPDVTILLAQLIPSTHPLRAQRVPLLNAEIPALAASKTQPNSPVMVVDHFSDFSATADTYDGTHPNVAGEQKMAQSWFDALEPLLDGTPSATSTNTPPVTATNTAVSSTVTATPTGSTCGSSTVLIVGDSQTLSAPDQALVDRLVAQGHGVVIRGQNEVVSGDAVGKDLIMISDSINSRNVGSTFTDTAVPVIIWESGLYDDMKLTGSVVGVDYNYINNQTQLAIVNGSHPLAGGLAEGTVTVVTVPHRFYWGVPTGDAITIATLADDASRSAIFAYEAGDAMVGMTAPARRVAFFNGSSPDYNAQAWQLFDAAVVWSLNCDEPPTPTATPTLPLATATSTNTAVPTNTATATATEVVATATNTPIATETPTGTATAVPTNTATATATSTAVAATATNTPTATETPPPPTATATSTATATPTGSTCSAATILFVGDSQTLSVPDQALVDRLVAQGHEVIIRGQNEVVSGDAVGKDLIMISDSINSRNVGSTFTDTAVPVIIWESGLYDDMKLTGSVVGVDYNYINNQTQLAIVNGSHPLAGGLAEGTVTVVTVPHRFYWGVPTGDAITIATLADDASRSAIFAYEAGDAMVGMTAPARRVAFFNGSSPDYNGQAWQLFDAATVWALGCEEPVIVSSNENWSLFIDWLRQAAQLAANLAGD
ncbi:MAG: hypothetical protein IPM53_29285 [Anaerolineaceae bacterium]|nr:hypothetical protein [Anaerolineaceae bacterium]